MIQKDCSFESFRFPGTFFKANLVARILGYKGDLYIKWEGDNPTGTQKDRAGLRHAAKAYSQRYSGLTVGTCGNYGVSIAYFASMMGLKAVIFMPRRYSGSRIGEMIRLGARVIRVDGSYEDAVEASILASLEGDLYDANPGGVNGEEALRSFMDIAYEIVNSLGKSPDLVSVPVGNGTTLAGIYLGFKDLMTRGLTDRVPKMIGGTTVLGNQVALTLKRSSRELVNLSESDVRETEVNEPLVAIKSLDGGDAIKAILETKGRVYELTDEEMISLAEILSLERIDPLPASSSSLGAIREYSDENAFSGTAVAIITGRKSR